MKKAPMILAIVIFVFGMTKTVNADVIDNPTKWSQLPDMEWGFDILSFGYSGYDFEEDGPPLIPVILDDWYCDDSTAPITDVHWWGSYEYWGYEEYLEDGSPGNIEAFVIGIFGSEAEYDDDGFLIYAQPTEPLGFEYYPFEEVNETYYGEQELTEHSAFQYYVDLDEPFDQEEGEIYWLMIAALHSEDVEDNIWGWKTSYPYNVDFPSFNAYLLEYDGETVEWLELVYFDFDEQLSGYPNFDEYYPYDPEDPIQMAFELTTAIPEPTTMILLGSLATGLFGMAAVRRKK